MKWEIEHNVLHIGGKEYEFPYKITDTIRNRESVIVYVDPVAEVVTIESDAIDLSERNITAFSEAGYEWAVEAAPDNRDGPKYTGYRYVFSLRDRLFAVHRDESLYEIQSNSGDLVGSWHWNELPIGDTTAQLDGEVQKVVEGDERIYVRSRDLNTFYCFDYHGERVWKSNSPRGMIFLEEEVLYERCSIGPHQQLWYRLDKDTGERIEETEPPDFG